MSLLQMRKQAGFSLTELMIALALGLFVSGAAAYLFISANSAYNTQSNYLAMQENARTAFEVLKREIRGAGYLGCSNLRQRSPTIVSGAQNIPATAIQVFPNGDSWPGDAWIDVTRATGPDVIVVRWVPNTTCGMANLPELDGSTLTLSVSGGACNFNNNENVVVADCRNAALTTMTKDAAQADGDVNTTLELNASGLESTGFGRETQVWKYAERHFFIGLDPDDNSPTLYMIDRQGTANNFTEPEEVDLIGNVYDMQFFISTTNEEGGISAVSARPDNNTSWNDVVLLTIALSVRSNQPNEVSNTSYTTSSSDALYQGNSTLTYADDARLKQTYRFSIALRNSI